MRSRVRAFVKNVQQFQPAHMKCQRRHFLSMSHVTYGRAARLTRLRCRVQNESKFGRQVEFLPGSAPTSEFIEKLHCLPHGTVDQAPLQCAQFKSPGANHFYTVGLTLSGALSLQARSILMYNIELNCISTCDFYMYRKYTGEHD